MTVDLAPLLGTEETAALEFKREARDRSAIRKAICAFANDLAGLGGGDLLIGVDRHGQPVAGVDTSWRGTATRNPNSLSMTRPGA